MQLHQLKPIHKPKKTKRLGQGDKFCGRGSGTRGQKARAGRNLKPIIRDLIKRYHKLRGYKFKPREGKPVVINVETLEKKFKTDDKINPQILLKLRLIRKMKGKVPKVKILGKGEIKKALIVEGFEFSKSAQEKIKKAGGTIRT
jgi:large subunit ribosomal protein L15